MAEEKNLWIQLKNNTKSIIWTRIESSTGLGIPDEIKPLVFTPLFTTKAQGQGFGLAVCKRVIEAQGGTIEFESRVGKGAKFTIKLPITK